MEYTLVGNLDDCRLEAEVSDADGNVLAILFEDDLGWHLKTSMPDQCAVPIYLLDEIKARMQPYVNRLGFGAPQGTSIGELALWLMLKADGTAMGMPYLQEAAPNAADFYVDNGCCLSCGVPQLIAPDLVGWVDGTTRCFWKKQPQTPLELDRALRVLNEQEAGCHRYAGTDPQILARLAPELWDRQAQPLVNAPSPKDYNVTMLPENGPGLLRRLMCRLRASRPASGQS